MCKTVLLRLFVAHLVCRLIAYLLFTCQFVACLFGGELLLRCLLVCIVCCALTTNPLAGDAHPIWNMLHAIASCVLSHFVSSHQGPLAGPLCLAWSSMPPVALPQKRESRLHRHVLHLLPHHRGNGTGCPSQGHSAALRPKARHRLHW